MAKLILNRLKIVLAEKGKTNLWLAEKLGVNANTVSKWVNNTTQPSVEMFYRISVILNSTFRELFEENPSKNSR